MSTTTTFSYQDQLPSLPVPSLNQTLSGYLRSVKALATDEEYERTLRQVTEFGQSPLARQLQEALETRAKEKRNWLEDWWYDVYTEVRAPLSPYLSFVSINGFHTSVPGSQVSRAADVAYHWTNFWLKIKSGALPITKSRGVTWDMSQYHNLFNAARVPDLPKDRMVRYFKSGSEGPCPSHIIVFCRGQIWKVEMLPHGKQLNPDELFNIFHHIKQNSTPTEASIISLTTLDRDSWAKHRKAFQEVGPETRNLLEEVESSIFCLTLVDDTVAGKDKFLESAMLWKTQNAWQDKSINLVVCSDGQLMLLGEHSNVDAIVVVHASEDVGPKVRKEIWKPTTTNYNPPTRLSFELPMQFKKTVVESEEKLIKQHRVKLVTYRGYGNDWLKSQKLYADTVIQIVLQLAYLKTHGSFAPIYETASTRKFYHGRTETVRGCTVEMVDFGRAVMEGQRESLKELFKKAYDAHNRLMEQCMNGQGFDRHLLGLKNTLAQFNKGCSPKRALPKFMTDPVWQKTGGDGNFLLSTSFTGYMLDQEDGVFGYVCAMRPDGYGVFYKIGRQRIVLTTTDWINTNSNLHAFGINLQWAFNTVGSIIDQQSKV